MKEEKKKELAGKHAAFESVMARFEGPLLRYACRLLNNNVYAAQDVVQEAFIKLFERWTDDLDKDPKVSSWLFNVTHNCAIDQVRKESRLQTFYQYEAEGEEKVSEPEVGKGISEDAEKAMNAMNLLDMRERQLVILKVFEEKSYREISEITGLTTANVGYILHHAMKKMGAALGKEKKT